MSFAQINYQQKLGSGPGADTIANVGCFLTAFSNLLERFGEPVDPPTLNDYFINHDDYMAEGALRDLLGWGSVSSYDGAIHVVATGSGAPSADNSIVKVIYKSTRTGNTITHFCLVHDAAQGLIIDSWDGRVKSWNVYGGPVSFATYDRTAPVPTAPAPAPAPEGKRLFLPSAAGTWRVYNLGGPYSVGHEVGKLAPGNFPPGLTYEVLGNVLPNFVKIHTESYGDVAIYTGPDTIAQFVDEAPAPPAPEPAPAPAPTPPAPSLPPLPSNTTYTKLPSPLELVLNKDANAWKLDFADDAHATAAGQLSQGTHFTAFGKAQRTDGDKPCYFMLEQDFGNADTTGVPNSNVGVNTVDLSPAPAPTPPATPEAPAAPQNASEEVKVPVTIGSWKNTFKEAYGVYRANKDLVVTDLDGKMPDQKLGHDLKVTVAGTFTKGGVEYYRTIKSQNAGHWYGIPKNSLVQAVDSGSAVVDALLHPSKTAHTVADDIDKIAADLQKDPEFAKFKSTLTPRGKAVARIAESEAKVAGFFDKVHLFKKKYK